MTNNAFEAVKHDIREMFLEHYDCVADLIQKTPGVTFRDADSREAIGRYLKRNPGLSFVALHDGEIIGCIMSGHDGRRGYLQHLVVASKFRRQGIASQLVASCITALGNEGIVKSHVDVIATNEMAHAYWKALGWHRRTDVDKYSFSLGGASNA